MRVGWNISCHGVANVPSARVAPIGGEIDMLLELKL